MKNTPTTIYWECLGYKGWEFCLAADDDGLCRVLQPNEPMSVLENWASRNFPRVALIRDNRRLGPYIAQFEEYFQGRRQTFDFPLDLRGTGFQLSVWETLLKIPYGTTKSYSEIAVEVNRPAAVRAVGSANGANPIPIAVPCHRVIGKNGLLTGYRGGLEIKEELLRIEGVTRIPVNQKYTAPDTFHSRIVNHLTAPAR